MNRFGKTLLSGRMITTAECLPPAGADAEAIKALSRALPSELDAIVVADNPDRIRGSALSVAAMLRKEKQMSVIVSMTTRDRNRIGLMSDAMGAAALGIEAILCISGEHQSKGICPQAAAANDLDSIQFAQAMKKLVLYGSGLNGKEKEAELKLQIGATAQPYMRPMELNLLRLKKKISVGADFLLTQAVFDLKGFVEWMNAVRAAGLDKRTAIIPSVLPLDSVEKAKALQQSRIYGPIGDDIIARISQSADAAREGVSIASEMAIQLRDIPGVRGIHILCGGCESLASEVMKQAGI
jgi:methylenetetrahydrofolate reductase (NADPH)